MKKIIIIGEKKVGKTTLFNQLKKISKNNFETKTNFDSLINYKEEIVWFENHHYNLIDTPSFILFPKNEIENNIKKNLENIIFRSHLIIWIIDFISENTLLIKKFLDKLKLDSKIIFLFNKSDIEEYYEDNLKNFKILHPKKFFFVSLIEKEKIEIINREIFLSLDKNEDNFENNNKINLLIFGTPNSGKSTLMNCLLGNNRSIVTHISGTTKEPVSSFYNLNNINLNLIDTAGITKEKSLELYLWKKCNLAWNVIDGSIPLTKQIFQIINLAEKYNKALVIIVNKIDLIKKEYKIEIKKKIKNRLKSLSYCQIIFVSSLKKKGLEFLKKNLEEMINESKIKISKKKIEEVIKEMIEKNPPKNHNKGKIKIYFCKKINFEDNKLIHIFIFFVNDPKWIHFSYKRYIINFLRKNLSLNYLPVFIVFKKSV